MSRQKGTSHVRTERGHASAHIDFCSGVVELWADDRGIVVKPGNKGHSDCWQLACRIMAQATEVSL